MIQRIVLLKLTEEYATLDTRHAVAVHSRDVLSHLPGVINSEVSIAADDTCAQDWDVSLVIHFATVSDLEPFRVHPDHRAYVDEYLRPKLFGIKAWNFENEG